jgi:hypothetical protein
MGTARLHCAVTRVSTTRLGLLLRPQSSGKRPGNAHGCCHNDFARRGNPIGAVAFKRGRLGLAPEMILAPGRPVAAEAR